MLPSSDGSGNSLQRVVHGVIFRGGTRGNQEKIPFQDVHLDGCVQVCSVLWWAAGRWGGLTFKIKLVDVFQRLVDKVETSESLKKDRNDSAFRQPTRWNNESLL